MLKNVKNLLVTAEDSRQMTEHFHQNLCDTTKVVAALSTLHSRQTVGMLLFQH